MKTETLHEHDDEVDIDHLLVSSDEPAQYFSAKQHEHFHDSCLQRFCVLVNELKDGFGDCLMLFAVSNDLRVVDEA